ncbi:hypothetical protein [Pseudomonas fluorescens]|uniref:hypothetical protein n=1 Tax=Pseudomonas fluorescens TaxID=294 RepID=UPI001BE74F73|nr:hypothetical protein [Pseudomonas fluorescens]MBT2375376.1 hypothetical protein [Pseudomonas fluorescens]
MRGTEVFSEVWIQSTVEKGIRQGQMMSVAIEPKDMHSKFGRPKIIEIPWWLMEGMWSYSLHQREMRKTYRDRNVSALLLTNEGRRYSKYSVVDVMKVYERKNRFYV